MDNSTPGYRREEIPCYLCGSSRSDYYLTGEDDLTGMKGAFPYVKCRSCGLVYQNPRLVIDDVKTFYTDDYIAHRKKAGFGVFTPVYNWVMEKHDRDKIGLATRYIPLHSESSVLDVGCAVGTFLLMARRLYGCRIAGVDFKDTSYYPGFDQIEFHQGLFHEQALPADSYDLVTMWHFLEHDYHPVQSLRKAWECLKPSGTLAIEVPRLDSVTYRLYGARWPGVQAPQHTVLYSKKSLLHMVEAHGFKVIDYLPYGAFPPYFYIFSGIAFKILRGRGMNLRKVALPYVMGQALLAPVMIFQKHLNLSMQTVILRKM